MIQSLHAQEGHPTLPTEDLMVLNSLGRQDGAWWGQELGHFRTRKWHLQKYKDMRERGIYREC